LIVSGLVERINEIDAFKLVY